MNVETLTIPVERKCLISVVRGSLFAKRARLKEADQNLIFILVVIGSGFQVQGVQGFFTCLALWQTFHRKTRDCRIH